jgi:cell migration-inducing and hyaluronan-binding protein
VVGTPADFGQGGTYITDFAKTKQVYCFPTLDMFNGFTSIDRQTELNDDDGTLTGLSNDVAVNLPNLPPSLKQTISVNDDNYFTAPVETPQCLSNIGKNRWSPTTPFGKLND